MGLRESLKELQKNEKLSIKREVKKELTKLKKEIQRQKKCANCSEKVAKYFLKGISEGYCKECAKELFGTLDHLVK